MSSVESVLLRKVLESVGRGSLKTHTVSLDDMQFLVVVLPVNEDAENGRDESSFDRPWKALFLDWLRHGLTVEKAAELAGVTRRHAYRCRRSDEAFRRGWNLARSTRNRE